MAMRFGHRICSHVRMNNFSGVPTSLRRGGRSYFSEALSQVTKSPTALRNAMTVSTFAMWGGWFYRYNVYGCRSMVADQLSEMKIQEMLERLDREKFKSEDVYVEMLEREVKALKEKALEREIGLLDMTICQREVAALKAKIETDRLMRSQMSFLESVMKGLGSPFPGQRGQQTPGSLE